MANQNRVYPNPSANDLQRQLEEMKLRITLLEEEKAAFKAKIRKEKDQRKVQIGELKLEIEKLQKEQDFQRTEIEAMQLDRDFVKKEQEDNSSGDPEDDSQINQSDDMEDAASSADN